MSFAPFLVSLLTICITNPTIYRKQGRFTGLNICGFSLMKFFKGIFFQCLGQQCLLFNYSQENFRGILKDCETRKSLAQQIFSRLWYEVTNKFFDINKPIPVFHSSSIDSCLHIQLATFDKCIIISILTCQSNISDVRPTFTVV